VLVFLMINTHMKPAGILCVTRWITRQARLLFDIQISFCYSTPEGLTAVNRGEMNAEVRVKEIYRT